MRLKSVENAQNAFRPSLLLPMRSSGVEKGVEMRVEIAEMAEMASKCACDRLPCDRLPCDRLPCDRWRRNGVEMRVEKGVDCFFLDAGGLLLRMAFHTFLASLVLP